MSGSETPVAIVSAVIRRRNRILLVEQEGPDDAAATWMLPGGRVEAGEDPLAALAREVAEETGLTVFGASVAYEVKVDVGDPPGPVRAVTYDCTPRGTVAPADPDGFILRAAWVPIDEALRCLGEVAWYEREPLRRWLVDEAPPGARYHLPLPAPTAMPPSRPSRPGPAARVPSLTDTDTSPKGPDA